MSRSTDVLIACGRLEFGTEKGRRGETRRRFVPSHRTGKHAAGGDDGRRPSHGCLINVRRAQLMPGGSQPRISPRCSRRMNVSTGNTRVPSISSSRSPRYTMKLFASEIANEALSLDFLSQVGCYIRAEELPNRKKDVRGVWSRRGNIDAKFTVKMVSLSTEAARHACSRPLH
jgi:hypothetical protein